MSALPIMLRTERQNAMPSAFRGAGSQPEPAAAHRSGDSIAQRSLASKPTLRDVARGQRLALAEPVRDERRAALITALLAHIPPADRAAAKTAIPAILDAARTTGSNDPNQLGYLLATAQTESDFGSHMVETGHTKAWFDKTYGSQDGNRSGTDDGFAYRGRGYVQTTHAGRYAELSHQLGLPDVPVNAAGRKALLDTGGKPKMEPALVADPDKLTDPKLAARALVIGVKRNLFTHNAAAAIDKTIPAGKQPGDADFYHARALVNGIVKDQAQAIASHATTYATILDCYRHSVLGVPGTK